MQLELFKPIAVVTIEQATKVDFNKLCKYDTAVHVYPRQRFLEKWISAPNCPSYAAVNHERQIIGYAVVRSALINQEGWIIGPLFADNSQIARDLYRAVIEGVKAQGSGKCIMVYVPHGAGCHPESLSIAVRELAGVEVLQEIRMFTQGVPPNLPLAKIFAITSPELG